MTDIFDIAAPEPEKVTIRGVELVISRIDNHDLTALMKRFPSLRQALMGAGPTDSDAADDVMMMPAIIATALGKRDDQETELAVIARMTFGEQMTVFRKVMHMSVSETPDGPLPEAAAQGEVAPAVTP